MKGIHHFGGKGSQGTYQTIINYIPPHKTYIELFLGVGTIMRYKRPAEVNIGVEIDQAVLKKVNWQRDFRSVTVINDCAISFLKNLSEDLTDVFIYVDPPYPINSRRNKKKVYKFELEDEDHYQLLQLLASMKCKIAISTYRNPIYERLLREWNLITFQSQTRKGKATELLYMNYKKPEILHDFSFLGKDFTERQRIKRKIQREINKLLRLPVLERNAILNEVTKLSRA